MSSSTLAQAAALDVTPLPLPDARDTLSSAKLPSAQLQQILDQVTERSFDAPQSWEVELRLRRITIGGKQALLLRGTSLLCGGTGNCATWLFRHVKGRWSNMIDGEAPVVDGMGLARHVSHGMPDLVVTANQSASTSRVAVYAFDGQVYRITRCLEVVAPENGGPRADGKKVTCQ